MFSFFLIKAYDLLEILTPRKEEDPTDCLNAEQLLRY